MAGRLVSVRTDTRNEINAERLSNMWQGPFGNISLRMKSTGTFLTSAHRSHLPMPPRTGEGETGRRGSLDRFLIVFHCSIIAHVYWEACVATNESAKASSTDLWPV